HQLLEHDRVVALDRVSLVDDHRREGPHGLIETASGSCATRELIDEVGDEVDVDEVHRRRIGERLPDALDPFVAGELAIIAIEDERAVTDGHLELLDLVDPSGAGDVLRCHDEDVPDRLDAHERLQRGRGLHPADVDPDGLGWIGDRALGHDLLVSGELDLRLHVENSDPPDVPWVWWGLQMMVSPAKEMRNSPTAAVACTRLRSRRRSVRSLGRSGRLPERAATG